MIIDSSALIAIIGDEPERSLFEGAIRLAPIRLLGAPTLVETSMVVMARRNEAGLAILGDLVAEMRLQVVPFTAAHVRLAVEAFGRFGKGRHPAALNFGDCFSYALAAATGEALLFKGNDFARTDILRAM